MTGKQILAVIDPTAEAQPALERAAWLAKSLGAAVELFICDYDQGGGRLDSASAQRARERLVDRHLERLRSLAGTLERQGIPASVEARSERPLDRGIVRKVVEARPMLVVKDTHFHPALKRSLLSNTDWNLIRSCPAPLLLVKPAPSPEAPTVLAAVDPLHEHDKPADLDKAILAFAKELSSALRGRLHVLHSFDIGPMLASIAGTPAATMAVPIEEIAAGAEAEHRKALTALLGGFGIEGGNVHLDPGVPHEALVQRAERIRADFVVMGAVSRSGLKRVFVGSTAERVLDRLPCDLVIVKPPGFQAELD
jgi:universal stress protein E